MTEFMDKQIMLQRAGQKEYTEEEVRLIINGAIQEEREACARTVMEYDLLYIGSYPINEQFADAIRARGEHGSN